MRVLLVCAAWLALAAASSCASFASERADRPPRELLEVVDGVRARPVLLVHGFSGFTDFGPLGQYFAGVKALYEAEGVLVYVPWLPPYATSEVRASFLAKAIDDALEESGADKVHLIAHSQGGLDARYAISERGLGYGERVASLITISTPHHGTPLADFFLRFPAFTLDLVFVPFAWLMGAPAGIEPSPVHPMGSLLSMSTEAAARFNEEHRDPPGVRVFSIAALSGDRDAAPCREGRWPVQGWDAPALYLTATWAFLAKDLDPARREPNDGVVPVKSAMHGTFLGCVPADHLEVVGFNVEIENDAAPPFDHLALYARLLEVLRAVDASSSEVVLGERSP